MLKYWVLLIFYIPLSFTHSFLMNLQFQIELITCIQTLKIKTIELFRPYHYNPISEQKKCVSYFVLFQMSKVDLEPRAFVEKVNRQYATNSIKNITNKLSYRFLISYEMKAEVSIYFKPTLRARGFGCIKTIFHMRDFVYMCDY